MLSHTNSMLTRGEYLTTCLVPLRNKITLFIASIRTQPYLPTRRFHERFHVPLSCRIFLFVRKRCQTVRNLTNSDSINRSRRVERADYSNSSDSRKTWWLVSKASEDYIRTKINEKASTQITG